MKIYKNGEIPEERFPVRFVCPNCGCEFEADNTEYWMVRTGDVTVCGIDCPHCGKMCESPHPGGD